MWARQAPTQGRKTASPGDALPGLVLFSGVPRADLMAALDPPPAGVSRGAKEDLTPEALAAWLDTQLGPPLNAEQTDALRRAFTPEVVVPAQLTVRKPIERATGAALTDYLLSYSREQVLKHDLDLSDEAEAASDNLRLQLVNGVAGSGKSLILLYRARLLRQFFPRKRLLVLTHNRPLIHHLRRRYALLSGGDSGVEWRTFHGWCTKYWPTSEPQPQQVGLGERHALIDRVWQEHLADTTFSPELLRSEIDWLKDRLITTRQGYLEADRSGRGVALREGMRGRVYDAIHAYQEELRPRNQRRQEPQQRRHEHPVGQVRAHWQRGDLERRERVLVALVKDEEADDQPGQRHHRAHARSGARPAATVGPARSGGSARAASGRRGARPAPRRPRPGQPRRGGALARPGSGIHPGSRRRASPSTRRAEGASPAASSAAVARARARRPGSFSPPVSALAISGASAAWA
jgi:hypothetical protein